MGSIIFISSIAGLDNIEVGNGIYGAAKAALSQWMKFLAKEMANKMVRVNFICPGMTRTPLILRSDMSISEEQLNADELLYPLKRYADPEEVAYACIYFLSDASSWVTGSCLTIDGGSTL